MTRAERRKAARDREKAERKKARLLERVDAGREVVFAGGWPEWSPFVQLFGPGDRFCRELGCDYAYSNSRYQVVVAFEKTGLGWPPLMHLSIKTHDKRCVHDWRDMQRIKNELAGTMAEGIELFPAESRLMDEANQFHIYCIHPTMGGFPFGQTERTRFTPEELDRDHADVVPEFRPRQREFEDHHDAEGCLPMGQVPWPKWALEQIGKMLAV